MLRTGSEIVSKVLWYTIPVSFAYLLCENSLAFCSGRTVI